MNDKKNILIMIMACALVYLSMDVWLKPYVAKNNITVSQSQVVPPNPSRALETDTDAFTKNMTLRSQSPSLSFRNGKVSGRLDLKGAIIRQCALLDYSETTQENSPPVQMLSSDQQMYGVYFDWVCSDEQKTTLPTAQTLWQCDTQELTPEKPVTLRWSNSDGIHFFIDLIMDSEYLITVTQRIENHSDKAITCTPKTTIIRQGPVKTSGYMMLHEGPIGMVDGKLQEPSYADISKTTASPWVDLGQNPKSLGWMGLTDKYWLAALIPGQASKGHFTSQGSDFYRAQIQGQELHLTRGESQSHTCHVFLGPKKLALLENYEKKLSIDHFDMAVDFGWFYFITKPMFMLLSALQKMVGNFGLAILIMTIVIKILFFPLSIRSFRTMSRIRRFQPQIQALKLRFGDDKMKFNQAMLDLYSREKIHPVSGCLPMLIQIPIFFSLYKVLFVSIEMRHAPFWGWIHDLSAPDPTSVFSMFGLLPWTLPTWLHIGVWPILMGLTTAGQQMMNPSTVTDAQQKFMITYVMPVMFTFMLAQFPVGLVIYSTWSNFLTIVQQWFIMRYYQSVS
jgi:YidC/Oxa1 family membrane protein insertase